MKIYYICGYWSDLTTEILGKRPEEYWNAHFYVWGVKVGSHRRNFYVRTRDGNKYNITKDNFHAAREMFGRFIVNCLEQEQPIENVALVPVPSKDALLNVDASRSANMVREAMHQTALANAVCDALRWSRPLMKAHQGGERRKDLIKPLLEVVHDVRGRNVVLIDDLISRGGSMLASKEKLQEAGANVLGAITCGRTMYDREIKAFGRQNYFLTEEADDYNKAAANR